MKKFLIIKTGSTFDEISHTKGDFEDWTAKAMGLTPDQWLCVNVENGEKLSDPKDFAGCVITGSHSMVTEGTDWMIATTKWVRDAVESGLPTLGICFGHQLMANALGGKAAYHPNGLEIGTVDITLTPEAVDDPIFGSLPAILPAHVTHSQTALELPPDAVLLAASEHDSHQAFRVGNHAWGLQFHPEFDVEATRFYVNGLREIIAKQGKDGDAIFEGVKETTISAGILKKFVEYCLEKETNEYSRH